MRFKATIKNNTLTYENESYVRHHLSKLEGKPVTVDVNKIHYQRSNQQNRWYWKILEIVSNDTGHTEDELHRIFKGLFLPRNIVNLKGKEYSLAGSTTDLTKGQFVEYIERIRAEVAEMGIVIPDPEDMDLAPLINNK